jgi:hypothetical protein
VLDVQLILSFLLVTCFSWDAGEEDRGVRLSES